MEIKKYRHTRLRTFLLVAASVVMLSFLPATGQCAQVTLAWDPSREPDVAGYRLYYGTRSGNSPSMVDIRNRASCTIANLESGKTYYFAATAYDYQGHESGFSDEIRYTVPFMDTDGDGMPDDWEKQYGLDPDTNDAAQDPDSDGASNIDEYRARTIPTVNIDNSAPDAPAAYLPFDYDRVDSAPILETYEFYDPDAGDTHSETRWQIIRTADNVCVFDVTSSLSLTSLSVPKLVLDPDTEYTWKVQFIDNHGNSSKWSEPGIFTTDIDPADRDGDGIPDQQQIDASVDLDQDGTPDVDQDDLPRFDSLDCIQEKNLISWRLTQRLTSRRDPPLALEKRKGESESNPVYREFFWLSLSQDFDIERSREDHPRPFTDITASLEFYPHDHISLEGETSWSPYDNRFPTKECALKLTSARGDYLRTEYRRENSVDESLIATINAVVTPKISVRLYREEDLMADTAVESRAGVNFHNKCWSLDIEYIDEQDDRSVAFLVNLYGIGEIGTK